MFAASGDGLPLHYHFGTMSPGYPLPAAYTFGSPAETQHIPNVVALAALYAAELQLRQQCNDLKKRVGELIKDNESALANVAAMRRRYEAEKTITEKLSQDVARAKAATGQTDCSTPRSSRSSGTSCSCGTDGTESVDADSPASAGDKRTADSSTDTSDTTT